MLALVVSTSECKALRLGLTHQSLVKKKNGVYELP